MSASLSVVTVVQSTPVFTVFSSVHYEKVLKFEELLLLKVRITVQCRIAWSPIAIGYDDHAWPIGVW